MLHVTYEAVDDLTPGRLVHVDEARGQIRVTLDAHAPLRDVVRKLNIEIDQLMAAGHWFQWWKNEVICRETPGSPLRIDYLLHRLISGTTVALENKGIIEFHIDPALGTEQFAASINAAVGSLLAGGQWFQLYAGEIIDNSPEPAVRI